MKEGRNEWSNDRMKERKNQECLQPLWALTKALKPKQKSDLRGVVNAGQAKTHREWKAAQNFLRRRSTQVNETQESLLQEWEVLFYAKWHEMKWQSRDRQRKIEDQLKKGHLVFWPPTLFFWPPLVFLTPHLVFLTPHLVFLTPHLVLLTPHLVFFL